MLFDNHGRKINYVRLAVTDRCNLRCFYCMPHEGIDFLPKNNLLSFEEMLTLMQLLAELGITKVRITGGEPFVRKDMMLFLEKLTQIPGIDEIHVTTNGVLTAPYIAQLKQIGIKSINLSLDSLDRNRFFEMTRRDELPAVLETLNAILEAEIPLKINSVMMAGKNEKDIFELIELTRNNNIGLRFIEEMPFNGEGEKPEYFMSYTKIMALISEKYPEISKINDDKNSTSYNYKINGFKGTVGVIAAFSRTFCGTCNRLRITPTGDVMTCLYADASFNIKDLMRAGLEIDQIKQNLIAAVGNKAKDGFEAENNRKDTIKQSMTTIGG